MRIGRLEIHRWHPRCYRLYAGGLEWRVIELGPFKWHGQITRGDKATFKAQSQLRQEEEV